MISGVCDTKDICNGFKYEFAQYYIDSWNDDCLCDEVYNTCNDLLNVHANDKCTSFTHADIKIAIDKLKCSKSAGLDGLCAEHVKYAHSKLINLLILLFNNFCKHGFVPTNFCSGKITPIPKKQCSNKFQDYRPVSSINIISKIFEYCILYKIEGFVNIDELQFGFTQGGDEKTIYMA